MAAATASRRLHHLGQSLEIGPLASTRKGCRASPRRTAFSPRSRPQELEQSSATLVLFDAFGARLAEFVRAEEK